MKDISWHWDPMMGRIPGHGGLAIFAKREDGMCPRILTVEPWIMGDAKDWDLKRMEARATLASAAPELLEACKGLLEVVAWAGVTKSEAVDRAIAIISKAQPDYRRGT